MLKLFERLPDGVTVDGKRYKCNFDFRNVLRMIEIMQREDIYPDARDYLCLRCVISHKIRANSVRKVYSAVCSTLFPQTPETGGKRLTSYEQDAGLIRSAFRQVYGIDLFRDNLHWLEFCELLQNLPEGNRYEEIIGIRARPLPAPTKYNQKEREWLMQAKQSVALHLTEKEQEKKYDKDVSNVFAGLMGMIQKAQAAEQKEVNKVGE
jgi:hypothetical protein